MRAPVFSQVGRGALAVGSVALAAIIFGCAGKGPAQSAQDYLDNLKLYNYSACYRMLSHQDRLDRTMEQFLAEPPLAPQVSRAWFKAILKAVTYEIGPVRQEGNRRASVAVKVVQPDLPLWERTIDATVAPGASPDRAAQKSLAAGSYPKLVYGDEIVMVKEADAWRILADFPAREEAAKKRQEAIRAYHGHDYDKAIAAYEAALGDLDRKETTGGAGLKFLYQRELGGIRKAKSEIPEAQAYARKLALSGMEMKMTAARTPGIFGKIENKGGRAVDEAVCTATYYAGQGKSRKALFSERHTIIATPLEFVNFVRPVLPLVPGESRKFAFTLTAPAEIQQKAAPSLEITAITFTRSAAPLPRLSSTPAPVASPPAAGGPSAGAAAPPPPGPR